MPVFDSEPSGRLKLPSQEELLKADEDAAILAYSCGTMSDGRPYWAYVAVKPSLYRQFYKLSAARQTMVLSNYGEVLAIGHATEPPPEVVRAMREKYGADPAYEDKLIAEANRQQDVSVKNQEEKRIMDIVTMLKKTQGA